MDVSPVRARQATDIRGRALCIQPPKRTGRHGCCLHTSTPIRRPDPATYAPLQMLSLGQQPTWNSPDIVTNHWDPFRLMPEAEVVVRNLSTDASAIGVRVNAAVSRFGIGYDRVPIGTRGVNLPPGTSQKMLVPFPQWVMSGEQRIGYHVNLEHTADRDASNNYGSQIHDGYKTSVAGRSFTTTLPVRNPRATSQHVQVALLGAPPDLTVSFVPPAAAFAPFEERILSVHITVNAGLVGSSGSVHSREATLLGLNADGSVIDGATFIVRVDS
jgi:hypothetical protein